MDEQAPPQDPTTTEPEAPTNNAGEGVAMIALGVGLLSVVGCAGLGLLSIVVRGAGVAVLGMPILGAVAITIGVVALRTISRRGGTEGRGFAVAGLIMGIGVTAISGSFGIGVMRTYLSMKQRVAPVAEAMLTEVAAGNTTRALDAFAPAATAEGVDEDRLARYLGAVEGHTGVFQAAEVSLTGVLSLREPFDEAQRDGRIDATQPPPEMSAMPKPVQIVGASGSVTAWLMIDEESLKQDRVRLLDMLVVMEGGRGILLRDDGPLAPLAAYLGLVLEPY